jgi:hypothetical protein
MGQYSARSFKIPLLKAQLPFVSAGENPRGMCNTSEHHFWRYEIARVPSAGIDQKAIFPPHLPRAGFADSAPTTTVARH